MKMLRNYFLRLYQLLVALLRLGEIEQKKLSIQATHYREWLLATPRYSDPLRLSRSEQKVFAQHGEDGTIAEIFRRIGVTDRQFVEIGVSPLENNTLFLLYKKWNGLWLDGSLEIEKLPPWLQGVILEGRLRVRSQMLTRENVGSTLHSAKIPIEFDFLSLDVDMNTYALWEGLEEFRPRVVMIEYNASLGADIDWRVEYQPAALWNGSTCFGASLGAFHRLGKSYGYELVGCDLTGTNAYFVRSDLAVGKFLISDDPGVHYEPCRYAIYQELPGWRAGTGSHVFEEPAARP